MGQDEHYLIQKAKNKYKNIFPCGTKKSFDECFTRDNDNKVYFWFDTEDQSTHIEVNESVIPN